MKKRFSCLLLASMLMASIPMMGHNDNMIGSAASDNVFVDNGKSEYKIVYDKDIRATEYKAISECTELMYEATGVILPMVTDEEVTWSEEAKYICLGSNKYSQAAGVSVDKNAVGSNGYHVETKGNSAFILGGGDWGTIWGVYEFFKAQLGYECYYYDELVFDEEKCEKSTLVSINMNERPDYEWRQAGDGEASASKTLQLKMRMQSFDAWSTNDTIGAGHNFFDTNEGTKGYVPFDLKATHPNWFSDDNGCLCFTRDPEGLSTQVMSSLAQLITDVADSTDYINATFAQPDGPAWCTCSECQKVISKYGGANAATQVLFMKNYLSPKLNKYMEENYPDKEITLYMYAYWSTKTCPLVQDSQIAELKLPERMGVQYCTGFPERRPVYSLESANIDAWAKICDNFAVYDYAENFGGYLHHFDDFNKLQDNIRCFYEIGGKLHYNLMAYNNLKNSDWSRLHTYLEANLLWDVDADVNDLTERFFDNYYKDAAPYMKDWFYTYRAWSFYYDSDTTTGGMPLDLGQCNAYEQFAQKAFDSILKYKFSNPDLYDKLYERINLETIVYRFNMLYYYQHAIKDVYAYATALKSDCALLGIQRFDEHNNTIDDWFNNAGLGI